MLPFSLCKAIVRKSSKVVIHGTRDALSSQPHALVCPSLCTKYPDTHGTFFPPVQVFKLRVQIPKSDALPPADWCLRRLWPASPSACWREDFIRFTPLILSSQSSCPATLSTAKPRAWRMVLVSAGLWNVTLRFFFFFLESVNKPKQVERICWTLPF